MGDQFQHGVLHDIECIAGIADAVLGNLVRAPFGGGKKARKFGVVIQRLNLI
jgi:hypothetical protein